MGKKKYFISKNILCLIHFEIACYKNKAIDWRNGVEKDLRYILRFFYKQKNPISEVL